VTQPRGFVAFALAIFSIAPGDVPQASQQAQPTFRAGVDLVVVDVVVIDKNGAPVTDLTAADFNVTAGKRPRRIVASEFVAAKRISTAVATYPPDLPAPTNNRPTAATAGRSILFVVDVDEIRAGEGRSAMRAIADYVDGLSANDRVGLVALPYGTPRVDLTTNRQLIRDATGLIVGASRRMNETEMSPGEAAAIALGDTGALVTWIDRIRGLKGLPSITGRCELVDPLQPPNRPIEQPTVAPPGCKQKAQRTLDVYRRHSSNNLDSMRALAEAMAPLDGQKTIVLVSEGIYNDLELRDDLRRFASAAEKARVALYALHLDAPLMEAASLGGPTMDSRILDDRLGMDGMAEMTHAARGTAQRVIATATAALKRIDTELSGYYLIAFERNADDRDGQHVRIDVKVNRPGLDVRARSEFTPEPLKAVAAKAPKTPLDPKAVMGTLLQWPASVGEIGIDVDTFTMPVDATSPDVRVMIAAEITNGGRPVDVGFEVKDAKGKVVADTFDLKAELRLLPDARVLYPASVTVSPGTYTLTLGVIDADGKRGSIKHAFEAKGWPPGPLRMSAVFLGEVSGGAFRPSVRIGPERDTVVVRVEVHSASASEVESDVVRIEFTPVGAEAVALTTQGRLAGSANSTRRAATTTVGIRDLPRGDYIVRVSLDSPAGKVSAQSSRLFRKE
jgi:VWFA-related protein